MNPINCVFLLGITCQILGFLSKDLFIFILGLVLAIIMFIFKRLELKRGGRG